MQDNEFALHYQRVFRFLFESQSRAGFVGREKSNFVLKIHGTAPSVPCLKVQIKDDNFKFNILISLTKYK